MMDEIDFSKYSNEDLMKIAQGGSISTPEQDNSGFLGTLRNIGSGTLGFAKGAASGTRQAIGDLASSAINWPISGIEYLSGHKLPHMPHPHFLNEHPAGLGESTGQTLGELFGGFALPGGVGMKTAQLVGKGYKALRAGKELPLIGKLLAGGAGGALEGAAGNEKNRSLGGLIGSLAGSAGYALPAAYKFAQSLRSKNISKEVNKVMDSLHNDFSTRFETSLQGGEEAGANKFLTGQKGNVKLLKEVGEHLPEKGEKHLTYALEKYNADPTLTNAHYAQRDISKLARKFSGATKGSKEEAAYNEALKIKNNLLLKISEAFEKSGSGHHGADYAQSRIDYKNILGPYLKVPEIKALRKGDLREGKFADALLEETGKPGPQEEFMKKIGNEYPGLGRREKYNKIKKNKLAQGAALGAGGFVTAFLPYEIRKILGTH